ncbi:MAG: HAD family phosphatase [Candidatus Levybacteria bacterium]|nr:HAD family phosphatase [Candidatus Levybacteria bacterium]
MSIKVISFDVDGVLFNTDEIYFIYLRKALRKIGAKINQAFYIHHGYDDCIYDLSLSKKDIAKVKQVIQKQYYNDSILSCMRMKNGVLPALKSLSEKFKFAIGSGENKLQIERYLNHFSLTDFFSFIGHSALVKGRKSNPAYFRAITDFYGVKPNECLHVGDNLIDQYALNAHMHVVIIPTKYSKYLSFDSRCHILKNIKLLPRLLSQFR